MTKLTCNLIQCNTPTVNNRIYKEENLNKAIEEFNQNPNPKFGGLVKFENKTDITLNSTEITHKVEKTYLEDGKINIDINLMQDLELSEFEVFPIFMGQINENNVIDDLKIVRFDLISKKELQEKENVKKNHK